MAERSGGWWAVRVRELPGVFTQARRLDQVESMVRDALAAYLDTDPRSFEVGLVEVLPDAMAEEVRRARQARERASRTQADADTALRKAAAGLVRGGLTVRDVGRVLGISPQRVSQLTSASGTARPGPSAQAG
jgi:hypothetical protein